MNVTVVCDVFGAENNGTVIAATNLIRSLESKGHKVNIVCCEKDKKEGMGNYYLVKELNLGPLNNILYKNGVRLSATDKKVVTEAIKDADVVHLMVPFALSMCALKIAKKMGKPVTAGFHAQAENITAHFGVKNVKPINNGIYKFMYRHVYSKVDKIHYPTQFIRDTFESVVGVTRGVVISNGVNKIYRRERIAKPDNLKDKFVILSTGRLCSEKNQSVLLRAIALSAHKDEIHTVLAGAGPDRKKVERLIKKLKIDVEIGFFSKENLNAIINYSDLYCHPAEIEIESIACIEAISCGLVPVVANSPRCATKYFALDEKSLFENKNPASLAKKIDYWIEHPKEREEYSERYLKNAGKFDQDMCMDQMEKMLLSVVNQSKKIIIND